MKRHGAGEYPLKKNERSFIIVATDQSHRLVHCADLQNLTQPTKQQQQ